MQPVESESNKRPHHNQEAEQSDDSAPVRCSSFLFPFLLAQQIHPHHSTLSAKPTHGKGGAHGHSAATTQSHPASAEDTSSATSWYGDPSIGNRRLITLLNTPKHGKTRSDDTILLMMVALSTRRGHPRRQGIRDVVALTSDDDHQPEPTSRRLMRCLPIG